MEFENCRILAEGQLIPNDPLVSGINNNDLIIGNSGSGKTGASRSKSR